MDKNMIDFLTKTIDETLAELEELKKSDRFSASEIKIEGPGEGIAGKPVNGELEKDEDKDDHDEEDEEEKKKKKEELEKDEDKDDHDEDDKEDHDDKDMKKEETKKEKEEEEKKAEMKKEEKSPKEVEKDLKALEMHKKEDMKKSEDLMKSYVDTRLSPIESKLDSLFGLVEKLANAPMPAKSVSFKGITPLKKSMEEEGETLTKSQVVEKLFDLKKSGAKVDSADITSAELGSNLSKLISKYNIK